MGTNLTPYKNIYKGSDVYILGTSRTLLDISPTRFKSKVCIGANSSYLYKNNCKFYIGGHLIWPLLWSNFAKPKHTCIYHGNPDDLNLKNITVVNNLQTINEQALKHLGSNEILLGNDMVAFSATHLAVLIGAKRIFYVGFESKSDYHFCGIFPYHDRFIEHLTFVRDKYPEYKESAEVMLKAFYPEEKIQTTNKMKSQYGKHLTKYKMIFDRLKQLGVTPYTTTQHSIIYEAGGEIW